MAVIDLYSKRRKRELGLQPDVYSYDNFTSSLRTQICYVIRDVLSIQDRNEHDRNYGAICEALRREYGVNRLVRDLHHHSSVVDEVLQFIRSEIDIDRVLDAVELCFMVAEGYRKKEFAYGYPRKDSGVCIDACVAEINTRFKEHGKGYEISSGMVLRIDSEFIHQEAVKPAISFLNQAEYAGPRDEFFGAFEHYRHGNLKESLNDALKAFESTIKVVLELRGWEYDKTSPAKKLLAVLLSNNFLPSYHQNHLNALATLLESSVPTIRNKEGGHGQGPAIAEVEPEIAAYVLHMTASAIVMLCSLEKKTTQTAPDE
ncbi:STM4504/CBY_0614 family protein [Pseudomonas putida]|uniref:STM4504/CBY_0614 family protein n=1 Tax=Pseudomonas putida TaxID=303 RepID=UPI003466FDBD